MLHVFAIPTYRVYQLHDIVKLISDVVDDPPVVTSYK